MDNIHAIFLSKLKMRSNFTATCFYIQEVKFCFSENSAQTRQLVLFSWIVDCHCSVWCIVDLFRTFTILAMFCFLFNAIPVSVWTETQFLLKCTFISAMNIVFMTSFWLVGLAFLYVDLYQKPKWMLKYKIQPGKNQPVSKPFNRTCWGAYCMYGFLVNANYNIHIHINGREVGAGVSTSKRFKSNFE